MRWSSHRVITFSVVYFLTSDVISSLIAGVSSILPDFLEGSDYQSESWKKRHRTLTHWLLGWFVLMMVFVLYFYFRYGEFLWNFSGVKIGKAFFMGNQDSSFLIEKGMCYAGFFIVLGGFMHVIEDAFTGRVPIFNPYVRNFRLAGIRVGSLWERVIVFLFAGLLGVKFFLWDKHL